MLWSYYEIRVHVLRQSTLQINHSSSCNCLISATQTKILDSGQICLCTALDNFGNFPEQVSVFSHPVLLHSGNKYIALLLGSTMIPLSASKFEALIKIFAVTVLSVSKSLILVVTPMLFLVMCLYCVHLSTRDYSVFPAPVRCSGPPGCCWGSTSKGALESVKTPVKPSSSP